MQDYSPRINQPDSITGVEKDIFNTADLVFNIVFLTEFGLKVIGMGFFLEPGSYLRDGWNILDFIVVVSR